MKGTYIKPETKVIELGLQFGILQAGSPFNLDGTSPAGPGEEFGSRGHGKYEDDEDFDEDEEW